MNFLKKWFNKIFRIENKYNPHLHFATAMNAEAVNRNTNELEFNPASGPLRSTPKPTMKPTRPDNPNISRPRASRSDTTPITQSHCHATYVASCSDSYSDSSSSSCSSSSCD